MNNKTKKRRYITGFDGLRTIGVLGVILYHLNPDLFSGGYLGVPIFLGLTGYLISDQILRSMRNHGGFNLPRYYIKRIKRIYPGLLLMLFSACAYIAFFQKNLLHNLRTIVVTNVLNVYNFWQIAHGQSYFDRFANNESPFTHMWTLSIQGQFYFIWPLLFIAMLLIMSKGKVLLVTTIATLVSALEMALLYNPHVDPSRIYYGTDTRLFSILLGCQLALIWPTDRLRQTIQKKDKIFLDVVGLICFALMFYFMFQVKATDAFLYRGGMFIFSIIMTVMIAVVAHPASSWNRILTNPLFKWIGRLSYGIYLYQFPVMIFFESKVTNIADHPYLYPVIEVILILIISWLSYTFVEHPLATHNWKDLLIRLFSKTRKTSEVVVATILLLITLSGSYGLVKAGNAPVNNPNKSKLAKNINKNHKKNTRDNKKLERKMKSSDGKFTLKASKSEVSKWREKAKTDPVNSSYEKMGISQFDLQRAQDLQSIAIGDSVMVDGSDGLRQLFPNMLINADVSRHADVAISLLRQYKEKGELPKIVIIGMGTNGPVTTDQVNQIMDIVGKNRKVFWISVHVPTKPWEKPVNKTIKDAAKTHKNLKIIDWNKYSEDHPDWFYGDQVHPNDTGSKQYSAYIAKQVLKNIKY